MAKFVHLMQYIKPFVPGMSSENCILPDSSGCREVEREKGDNRIYQKKKHYTDDGLKIWAV